MKIRKLKIYIYITILFAINTRLSDVITHYNFSIMRSLFEGFHRYNFYDKIYGDYKTYEALPLYIMNEKYSHAATYWHESEA